MHPHHLAASALILPLLLGHVLVTSWRAWSGRSPPAANAAARAATAPPSGRAWRYCHRYHGTGARLRVSSRIWNYLRNLHKEGR